MLDWLLKNPQLIIFLIFGVIAVAGRIAQARKEQQTVGEREMRAGRNRPATTPPDEAARARRAQEDMRRKILARMERAQTPAAMPRPAASPVFRAGQPPVTPPPLPSRQAQPQTARADDQNDAWHSVMEKLSETQAFSTTSGANRAKIPRRAETNLVASPAIGEEPPLLPHDTNALRRAIILREILDRPVALR